MEALLFVIFGLIGAQGQYCEVKQLVDCNDLCDAGLEDPIVQEVRFQGVLASFNCIPNHVQVTLNEDELKIQKKDIGIHVKQ